MRAGRVFFGDLELFDGTLDLVTPEGHWMGQEVRADRADRKRYEVDVIVTGTSGGEELVVVERGERVARHRLSGASSTIRHEVTLDDEDTFVRVELYHQDGTALAFSNPIHFRR